SDDESIAGAIPAWQSALRERLPEWLVPEAFVAVAALPVRNAPRQQPVRGATLPSEPAPVTEQPTLQNETERTIAQLFAQTLSITEVGPLDNFFTLGGNSFQAVQCTVHLSKELNIQLPLNAFWTHPTVRALAQLVKTGAIVVPKALVPLKPSGGKPSLAIIPGHLLEPLAFGAIAKHMAEDQPVYTFAPAEVLRAAGNEPTLEAIATAYVQQLVPLAKANSVSLVGHGIGAYLAIEAARQLASVGIQVRLLGVLDTAATDEATSDVGAQLRRKILGQLPKMAFISGAASQVADSDDYTGRFAELFGELPAQADAPARMAFRCYEQAFRQYQMTKYDGTLHLFKTSGGFRLLGDNKTLGWKPWAKSVKVHSIPGDAQSITLVPHNKELATILQAAING
ncbi:MAG: hypothetical protein EBZ77_12855, partial [Chitinophagia bacterium]|nr:hypothetical protein [Chitinophagia bacterium]